MNTERWTYKSADGKNNIVAFQFADKPPFKAIIQIVHGMREYIGRYEDFAAFMAHNGYLVCGNDQLGHGMTAETPNQLGIFAAYNGHKYLVEDVHALTQIVKERHNLPVILLGHSMGSIIAQNVINQYGNEYAGCILSGTIAPGLKYVFAQPIIAADILLWGTKHRSDLLRMLGFMGYTKRIGKPKTAQDWLSRDKSVVESYRNNPLCMFEFSSGAWRDVTRLSQNVSKRSWGKNIPNALPIYIIAGTEDPVGKYGIGPKRFYDVLHKQGKMVQLQLYPNCRHELINELNKTSVYADIYQWCQGAV